MRKIHNVHLSGENQDNDDRKAGKKGFGNRLLNKTRVYFCLNTLFNQGLHIYKNNFVGSRFSDALLTLVVPGVPTATWAHSGLILSNQRPAQVKSKPSMGRVKYKLLKTGDPNQHYT